MAKKKNYTETNSTDSSRSWFCVLNIHCLYVKDDSELYTDNMTEEEKEKRLENAKKIRRLFGNMTPEEIVDSAIERWVRDKPQRTCAVNYEIGDTGNEHLHMVLCDPAKSRFSAVCKKYPGIHCSETKGTREQAEDYICKRGRFQEKAHTVVVPARFYGKISGKSGTAGDLDVIEELIEKGKTPQQIFDMSIHYRKYEKIVKSAFFARRSKAIPPLRDVNVIWHIGKAGSGKSYTFTKLCKQYGEDEVYFLSDYANNCSGGLDLYSGEKCLFADEYRGQLSYDQILLLLQGIKSQIHCRYGNAVGLWSEIHITSVLTPEECYNRMVREENRDRDSIEQLLRRINTMCYHFKEGQDYKVFEVSMNEYLSIGYEGLKAKAHGNNNGFTDTSKEDDVPFNSDSNKPTDTTGEDNSFVESKVPEQLDLPL